MNKTRKLYDADAYAVEFSACVLSCEEKDGGFEAVLDSTLFFPEEGGQSCDRGTLNGVTVEHVSIDSKSGVITHHLTAALPVGSDVVGKIDFGRRYRNMQNHSGEHIISGLINKLYGLNNVGFHLGSSDVTMDYDGELTRQQIDELETAANRAVYENIQIIAEYPENDKLADMNYRSKLDLSSDVRIVTIPGYDVCACCAPHVARTGEIGTIKITETEKYKGGVRLHMHCGLDALLDYRAKNADIATLSALLSVKKHETVDAVSRLLEDNARLRSDITSVTSRLCRLVAASLPETDGALCVFEDGIGAGGMRTIANDAVKKCAAIAVFDKKDNDCFNFILASEKHNAKQLLAALSEVFPARGGGSDKMVQGTITTNKTDIIGFFNSYQFGIV